MGDQKYKHSLFLRTTLFMFAVMFLSAMLAGILAMMLMQLGVIKSTADRPAPAIFFIMMVSSIVSALLSTVAFRAVLRPFDAFLDGMQEIRKGNYGVRVSEDHANEKVRYLAQNFNLMAQELNAVEALRSDFISSFSHEFKTPIASVRGFAKLLKNPDLKKAEREEYLDIIIQETERLSRLASNALNIAKIESLEAVAEKKEYRLDEQIRRCIVLLEPRWNKKKLNFSVELAETVCTGSEELMDQVWINLIDNAVKFTPEGGEIAVSLTAVQNSAIVTVSDNGCGMDEETQKRMFDKFFQGDRSRSVEGNGVGLSLVKKIVGISQGKIKVKSVPGEGTSITVVLPLSADEYSGG